MKKMQWLVPVLVGGVLFAPSIPASGGQVATVLARATPASDAATISDVVDGSDGDQRAARATAANAAFTAEVKSIVHDPGRVRLAGRAAPGASVFLGGHVVTPIAVRVDPGGAWTATAHVRGSVGTIRVSNDANRKTVDLTVELLHLIPPTLAVERDPDTNVVRVAFSGYSRSRFLLFIDGVQVVATRANHEGKAWYELADVNPGRHLVRMEQRFDGAINGSWEDTYLL